MPESPATDSSAPRFAVIVPIGASPIGLWRGLELIRSLVVWEPTVACCVILDDSTRSRALAELSMFPASCRTISLTRPIGGCRGSWLGELTAGILAALAWIDANADVDFVLRIDTDALVIGPFARDVALFLEHNPDTGVVGTLGKSNNPEVRARPRRDVVPRLLRARNLWPVASEAPEADDNESRELETFGPVSLYQRRQFDRIRPHLDDAMANGYAKHEYCQGGVLGIGRMMVRRMSAAGYLSQADAWRGLPFPDDYVLAMYSRGVGLNIADFSGPGEPFGSQSTGLPFPMEELVARGHSLIHSVRHDKRADERTIRRYFSQRAPREGR